MTYLREVVDVAAVVSGEEYDAKKFASSLASLDYQKYCFGQVIQWEGDVDGLLDVIELPYVVFVQAGSVLTPTMLESVYPKITWSKEAMIRTKCVADNHSDEFVGHSIVRLADFDSNSLITTVDVIGGVCD